MPKDTVAIAMEEWLSLGNVLKAEQLLLAAANMGNGLAAHNLGTLYAVGGQGVEANAVKSMFWYEKALESGFEAEIANDPEWFRKQ